MDQIKIGKFISELRKSRNMTQEQLGEKIGVSFKTISKWENGRGLPELSLLKPLSEELGITVNELLSGEKVEKENYLNRLEENMINTIEYTEEQKNKRENIISIGILTLGIIITISAITIFPTESSWGSIYSVIGAIISAFGFAKLMRKMNCIKRLVISTLYFIACIVLLIVLDFVNVVNNNMPPRFSLVTTTMMDKYKTMEYVTPICNVFRINSNTKNEYYIIDTKRMYDVDTVPKSPFNLNKSSIENISKYQNKYVGNNSNIGNLISNLPLSEYGYVFEIDSENYGIIIDYHITDWYINDELYLEKSLMYNSVSFFTLIDNLKYIQYNFTGNSYKVNRDFFEKNYPNYKEIIEDGNIKQDKFNLYVLDKMNDDEFVKKYFEKNF